MGLTELDIILGYVHNIGDVWGYDPSLSGCEIEYRLYELHPELTPLITAKVKRLYKGLARTLENQSRESDCGEEMEETSEEESEEGLD